VGEETPHRLTLEETDAAVSEIARLPEGSVVRRTALALIRGETLETIRPLVGALADPSPKRWRERAVAAWTLGKARLGSQDTDTAVSALLEVLENGCRESLWRRYRRALGRSLLTASCAGMAAFLLFALYLDDRFGYIPLAIAAPALLLRWFHSLLNDVWCRDRVRAAAATALGHLRAPESAGTLAAVLHDGDPDVRHAAAQALHELLPTLTAGHFWLLGAQSIANLGRALSCPDGTLAFRVLEALEKVGTSHAIPFVERAARRGRTARFRDAASRVLSLLHERQSQENQRFTLLRPAEAPDASLLLRPARASGECDTQQLLRPADP
jgi:HEAT repeat protein